MYAGCKRCVLVSRAECVVRRGKMADAAMDGWGHGSGVVVDDCGLCFGLRYMFVGEG